MKQLLFSICILLAISSIAQNSSGTIAGVNYTSINLKKNSQAKQNGKPGLYAGFYRSLKLSKTLNFKPELIFSLQRTQYIRRTNYLTQYDGVPLGFTSEDGNLTELNDVDVNISEFIIQLPLMFEYVIKDKIKLGIGPQVGYVLIERTTNNNDGTYDFGGIDNYRFGLSYAANLGYILNDKNSLNLRYTNRITYRNTLKNSVLQIGLYRSL